MITSDNDWSFEFAILDQIVHCEGELRALTITEPADAGRQSLKANALARKIDPAAKNAILWKHLQNQIVGHSNIRGLSRQCNPAEGTASLAEQRTDICRNESREVVCFLHSILE